MTRHTPFATAVLTLALGIMPSLAFGQLASATASQHAQNKKTTATTAASTKQFTGNRLRACQRKQPDITATMQRIGSQGQEQLAVFHDIAEKTKTFYTEHGYAATGYDQYVAEVDALYGNASASVSTLTSIGDTWSCANSAPKDSLSTFRDSKKAEVVAVQAYKDKVRGLIELVKRAAEEKQS